MAQNRWVTCPDPVLSLLSQFISRVHGLLLSQVRRVKKLAILETGHLYYLAMVPLPLSAYQGVWTPNCLEFRRFAYFCRTLGFCLYQHRKDTAGQQGWLKKKVSIPRGHPKGTYESAQSERRRGMSQEELLRDREFTEWQEALAHHNSKQWNIQTTCSPWLLVHPECTHQRSWKSVYLLWLEHSFDFWLPYVKTVSLKKKIQ